MANILTGLLKIFIAFFLVLLNGFFVATEFALVKVRKTRLAELSENGSKRAKAALDVAYKIDSYLSATQLGITLASLGLGWLGEPTIATFIEPLFKNVIGWSSFYTHTVAIVIAFILITYLHIVFGELLPKSLAIQKAETLALNTAGILRSFYRLFYPIIWSLNKVAVSLYRVFGIRPANEADLAHTEEELRMLVGASERHGFLDQMEGRLLDNVFDFSDRVVSDVMVPRQDMICLFTDDTISEVLETVRKCGLSRYPLCDGDKDNVIGLVHIRDVINLENNNIKDLTQIKRDILIVPEGMPVSLMVQKMRSQRTHMAVVADEFGGTAGLVTIEDLLEELVGEIYDEFEREQPDLTKTGEDEFEINGRVLLEDVSELLGVNIEDETVSTIGGLIFTRLGRKPRKGDQIEAAGFLFTVKEVTGTRIVKVNAKKKADKVD